MRIYIVFLGDSEQLVEANSPSQAVMYVAQSMITARAAKPADVARIMATGGKVQQIKKGPANA